MEDTAIRRELDARRAEVAAAHRRGAEGFSTCVALTVAMDEAVRSLYDRAVRGGGGDSRTAVLALGGYGRRELFPGSDVDLMVLCPAGREREAAQAAAKEFLHLLWDAGVDVGHSVRTVEEALAMHGRAPDAWASMVEGRFLCGDSALAGELARALRERSRGDGKWFIEGVFADLASRLERYGSSVKLLEPNIKKSSGGLRDLHALYWLHCALDPDFSPGGTGAVPALLSFLDALARAGVLDADRREQAVRALGFLFRVRHEMHYRRGGLHDTLEYALQAEVAEGLGYAATGGGGGARRGVENFMSDYYLHARTIRRLHELVVRRFREMLEPARPGRRAVPAPGGALVVDDGKLLLAPGGQGLRDGAMQALAFAAEEGLEVDPRLRDEVERAAGRVTDGDRASPALASAFLRILRSGRAGPTLRLMNDVDLLGSYIPEFGRLVAFFQHNVYHYYTVDEHTIIAIENAERLRDGRGPLADVFRSLARPEVLYLALLLHDAGKPIGIADHETTGVEIARVVLGRLGQAQLLPDVGFLIRNHLVMEQVAFRRNIHDPATVREFAARFGGPEQLDLLYVHTYADLSAVNTNVWTQWKGALLQELHQRASEVLRRKLAGTQIEEFHREQREAAVEQVVSSLSASLPREHVEQHLQGIQNEAYVHLFSEREIARHLEAIREGRTVAALFAHDEGHTEVTVIARDAPYVLSKFCAVLAANDATIFDANVFTHDDGTVIDRFRVSDAASRRRLEDRVCAKIAEDLAKVMDGALDIEHLFQEHHRRWRRRPRQPANPHIRTDVVFEDAPRHTIIDVYAADAVGFLYRVTETMSRLGLDIYFAKIATRVDGIVDAFYVLDRGGSQVTDAERRRVIREDILGTIQAIAEQELG